MPVGSAVARGHVARIASPAPPQFACNEQGAGLGYGSLLTDSRRPSWVFGPGRLCCLSPAARRPSPTTHRPSPNAHRPPPSPLAALHNRFVARP